MRELRLQEKRGTYKAQRLLAGQEAEEFAEASRNKKCPDLYLLYVYAAKALKHAKSICLMSRRKERGSAKDFVLEEVRLAEYFQKLRDYPNLMDHLQQWPKNPGIAIAWFAGRSALEVIIQFTQAITTAVIIGRGEGACRGATSYDTLQVSPECDPRFAVWQERTITELCEKTIPKPDVWPSPADIFKECKQVLLKLEDEYNKAEKEAENKSVVSGTEEKVETQKSDKTGHRKVISGDGKNIPKKDIPVFPDITPSSIKEGRFRVFEKGDFATDEDVQILIMLLFNEPECEFYYFGEKGTQLDSMFSDAIKRGDLMIKETKFFYYKHPKFIRDYIHIEIRDGNYRNDWEKEVVQKGPMFCRSQLELTQRKKRELEIQQIKTELDTKREREGMIEAKPPETLAKMLWLKQHGKKHWKLISITILVILIPSLFVLPKIELFSKKPNVTANSNIFADISKDGTILRSNEFPWEIKKTKDRDGNILYTIVDRRGDATAISVVPDNPKYTVYQSYDGMVIKFTCAEEKISDFTIKVKY